VRGREAQREKECQEEVVHGFVNNHGQPDGYRFPNVLVRVPVLVSGFTWQFLVEFSMGGPLLESGWGLRVGGGPERLASRAESARRAGVPYLTGLHASPSLRLHLRYGSAQTWLKPMDIRKYQRNNYAEQRTLQEQIQSLQGESVRSGRGREN